MSSKKIKLFQKQVWKYWKKSGRHELPWRKTANPYYIMVSEVMLQQTQVSRVVEKYKEFLKTFPTVRHLARAPLGKVLKVWSGLGYNRRGKYLHDAAKIIVEKYNGTVPTVYSELAELPGMGPYTASAIRVFAFNFPDILIETNVRAVYIHHFFERRTRRVLSGLVSDVDILPIARKAAEGQDPRTWHAALMDYGVHIKNMHKNPARRSRHYVRQSKFEGSLRQIRGAILQALTTGQSMNDLRSRSSEKLEKALASLGRDGLIVKKKRKWRIA